MQDSGDIWSKMEQQPDSLYDSFKDASDKYVWET